jgi:beta-galactosidase
VDICDADNNTICTASNPVQFSMSGPARNVGIASGDWTNDEPYKGTSRKAYQGKVLIVIQSTPVPGTINLTVTSPGLTPAALTLKTN